MLKLVCLVLMFTSLSVASLDKFSSAKNSVDNEVDKALRFMGHRFGDAVQKVQKTYHHVEQKLKHSKKQLTLTSFSYSNCGSSSDLLSIKSLTVSPDPIHVPGNVTVSFSGSLSQKVLDPVKLSLEIKKKVWFWVPVPCVDDLGSCDYEDICPLLANIQCPPVFPQHAIPCQCPFKSGAYSLPSSVIDISSFGIPSWLEDGDFQVTAKVSTKTEQIMCLFIEFSLAN